MVPAHLPHAPNPAPLFPTLLRRSIDVTTTDRRGEAADEGAADAFADVYAASELAAANRAEAAALLASAPPPPPPGHSSMKRVPGVLRVGGSQGTVTPWWWGLAVLLRYRAGELGWQGSGALGS